MIRNVGIGPSVDEFIKAFEGRSIYSIRDLYSGYDQFQLSLDSQDIMAMRTPIELVWMCTLPKGATNSVSYIMNAMNKVLRDFILDITIPFLDDIPIKGCLESEKDEILELIEKDDILIKGIPTNKAKVWLETYNSYKGIDHIVGGNAMGWWNE